MYPTQEMPVKHLVLVTRGIVLLGPTDTFIRPVLQDLGMELIY